MTEYETIITKIDLLNEKLELYKNVSDEQIKSIRDEGKVYQDSIRSEIKAYQDANKQQLNVSLGVLVTAAIAILVSVIIGR
jgi:CHASE3 domain sensor protein